MKKGERVGCWIRSLQTILWLFQIFITIHRNAIKNTCRQKNFWTHTQKNQKHWMLIESINLHKNLKIGQSFQFTLNIIAWTYWHINLFGIRKVCMRKIQKFNKLGVHQSIVEMKLQDIVMFCTVDTFLKGFKWKMQCFWVRWTCLVWLWKHKECLLVEVEFKWRLCDFSNNFECLAW